MRAPCPNPTLMQIVCFVCVTLLVASCGDSASQRPSTTADTANDALDAHSDVATVDTLLDTAPPVDTAVGPDTVPADTKDTTQTELPPTPGSLGDTCDAARPCATIYVCAGGTCTRDQGDCVDDSDCQGDAYCCTQGCDSSGTCVAYGAGPRGDTNPSCTFDIIPGQFEADTQCEWSGPPTGDPFPGHVQVLTTPLVADLPNNSGAAAEIIIVTYNFTDGGSQASVGSDPAYFGVIRVLNGQTCEQLESIDDPAARAIGSSPPAIADLDNDGKLEIVTQKANSGLIAFKWDDATGRFARYWLSDTSNIAGSGRWDGPAIHDLDNDGFPEVISGSEVYDGRTGARRNPGQVLPGTGAGSLSVVADVDMDGIPEHLAGGVFQWDTASNTWQLDRTGSPAARHYGYADFGTPGVTAAEFDPTLLDGIAEIVTVGGGSVALYTLDGQVLMQVGGFSGGGPPTIGDFDNDGFPEIASAGGNAYRVFDLDCAAGAGPGCVAPFIRWTDPSQDLSSATTGSSIFDFEGDGKAEAVYADECFTRIYDGTTGEVLFSSFRTSCTWYENAVIADPDRDSNTEILVGSNANCSISCPAVDPIHVGVQCQKLEDCFSGVCDAGYCRCENDGGCEPGYSCVDPPAGTPGFGPTCRAYHPPGVGRTGLRVLRDRLDRWASSRAMWNQHAYSVTNILDDGKVPATSAWQQNFAVPGLNNFRQNVQGATSANQAPDITGRFDDNMVCEQLGSEVRMSAWVCNRGEKPVGAAMPATFYLGDPATHNVLCVSYTQGPVPVGDCLQVSCTMASTVTGTIYLVVNDDGANGKTTVECNADNNTDSISVANCNPN